MESPRQSPTRASLAVVVASTSGDKEGRIHVHLDVNAVTKSEQGLSFVRMSLASADPSFNRGSHLAIVIAVVRLSPAHVGLICELILAHR